MLKQTPLNAIHRAAGAKMVDFGGWDMPVNYGSQIEEHHAVRRDAGMFDVSHMLAVDLDDGERGAREFLRYALANNVDKLDRRRARRSIHACSRPDGGVLDDLIVYFLREGLVPRSSSTRRLPTRTSRGCSALIAARAPDAQADTAARSGDDRGAGAART